MKKLIILLVTTNLTLPILLLADSFKPELYKEIQVPELKAKPEDSRNKRIFYKTGYLGYRKIFPNYIIDSGFKSDKYYWFMVNPELIPALTKKTDIFDTFIQTLQKESVVKVYGKIKKLKYSPQKNQQDFYYLDLEHLELVAGPPEKAPDKEEDMKKGNHPNKKEIKQLKRLKKLKEELGGEIKAP